MKIVIDIPDSLYENILICWENIHPKVWKILKDGTVLPKGHGRLIDADAFIEKLKDIQKEVCLTLITADELMQNIIETLETSVSANSDAPTVLDAEVEHG